MTPTNPTPPTPGLADLFHRRWAVPILAHLHVRQGAKFVTLVHTTAASPTSIRQTLDHLIAMGWVTPNPGYGHPLRPEYILSCAGETLAQGCADLDRAIVAQDLRDVTLRKWSMPTVAALARGPRRFGEIASMLPLVTDRALSQTLRCLRGVPLVDRLGAAPAAPYTLAGAGMTLAPLVLELGRGLALPRPAST